MSIRLNVYRYFLLFLSFYNPHRYRFMELYYKSSEKLNKDRTIPSRTETVVIFLPDIRCCVPTRVEWDTLIVNYKQKVENVVTKGQTISGGSGSNKGSSSNRKSTDSKSISGDTKDDVKKGSNVAIAAVPASEIIETKIEPTDDKGDVEGDAAKVKALHIHSIFFCLLLSI